MSSATSEEEHDDKEADEVGSLEYSLSNVQCNDFSIKSFWLDTGPCALYNVLRSYSEFWQSVIGF